ncbi:hypothetical protein B0H15DRAFT_930351 [Mycena belliarum]|uniref:Uncharacterized protein n=1 Tax=Mycena belliarum TaxID=1033014 RepID=A0AAD6UAP1_9AGAR|nr:hypothetical protein B0H15DRAFT_906931 [Mycena belliae]KAJ7090906.1 hypothetical protein B0H15DRAFT_930351 [Mycena belliae]
MLCNSKTSRSGYIPELPYELEREIFELTARAHPKCAPQLALVASHVQTWVEAVIYETIVLGPTSDKQNLFWRTFTSRRPLFFARNIRALHLTTGFSFSQGRQLIAVCTNLSTLTSWTNPLTTREEFCALLSPNLRHLSVNASILWSPEGPTTGPDLTHPVFKRLTHLEVVNPPSWFEWTPLLDGSLPNLTHLAFGDLEAAHAHCMVDFFLVALRQESPRLEMLIAVSRDAYFLCALELAEIKDARLIVRPSYHHPLNPTEYWDAVARREIQFWRPSPPCTGVSSRSAS